MADILVGGIVLAAFGFALARVLKKGPAAGCGCGSADCAGKAAQRKQR